MEKRTAARSRILVWKTPCTEESGGLQLMVRKELDTTDQLSRSIYNVVLISAVQESDSAIRYIYTHSFSYPFLLRFITGY